MYLQAKDVGTRGDAMASSGDVSEFAIVELDSERDGLKEGHIRNNGSQEEITHTRVEYSLLVDDAKFATNARHNISKDCPTGELPMTAAMVSY